MTVYGNFFYFDLQPETEGWNLKILNFQVFQWVTYKVLSSKSNSKKKKEINEIIIIISSNCFFVFCFFPRAGFIKHTKGNVDTWGV